MSLQRRSDVGSADGVGEAEAGHQPQPQGPISNGNALII